MQPICWKHFLCFKISVDVYRVCICSVQTENLDNFRIVLREVNTHFGGQSENSNFAVQFRNCPCAKWESGKVRIFIHGSVNMYFCKHLYNNISRVFKLQIHKQNQP